MYEYHICTKEDRNSITYIEYLVHCPKCKTPVEKIDRCNHLNCSMCQINFDENNGQNLGNIVFSKNNSKYTIFSV